MGEIRCTWIQYLPLQLWLKIQMSTFCQFYSPNLGAEANTDLMRTCCGSVRLFNSHFWNRVQDQLTNSQHWAPGPAVLSSSAEPDLWTLKDTSELRKTVSSWKMATKGEGWVEWRLQMHNSREHRDRGQPEAWIYLCSFTIGVCTQQGPPASGSACIQSKKFTAMEVPQPLGFALSILTATSSCFLGSITLTFLSLEAVQIRLPFRFQLTL